MNIDSDSRKELNIQVSREELSDCDAYGLLSLIQGDVLSWAKLKIEQQSSNSANGSAVFTYTCQREDVMLIKAFVSSGNDCDIKKLIKSYSEFAIKNDTSHYMTDIEHVFTDGTDVYLIYTPFKLQRENNAKIIKDFVEGLCAVTDEKIYKFSALMELLDTGSCSLDEISKALSQSAETTQPADFDYGQTTLLEESVGIYDTPNLLRINTNEKIYITKRNFIVGKSRSHADYTIENNAAISRVHAQFNCEGNEYYIVDKGSTNKTFVNGYMISPNYPIKISNGDEIKLADEVFIFSLN